MTAIRIVHLSFWNDPGAWIQLICLWVKLMTLHLQRVGNQLSKCKWKHRIDDSKYEKNSMDILNEQIPSANLNIKQHASFYCQHTTWAMFIFNKVKCMRMNNWAWKWIEYIFSSLAEGEPWIIFQEQNFSMMNAVLEFLCLNSTLSTNCH